MRQKSILLAGNWKMNHGPKETAQFLNQLHTQSKQNAQMRLYVPFVSIASALETTHAKSLALEIGAQNVHFEKSGAFTGEISVGMLLELGVKQALIGHSERRQYFNETNETVLKRTVSALTQGLEVLVCIGETQGERNAGMTKQTVQTQLAPLLSDETCLKAFGKTLHIAYEPVWAIGTGVTASPEQAEEVHASIRSLLAQKLGPTATNATRVLYGGSVTPTNFKELLACPNIDGALVGGASVKVDSWTALWNLI
ncbi:MAG: triose-phosphate isomerase [Bdellovibrionales bacterium]|nr:triose-phosphate isomerase [Oligoflexia bacterium]